MPFQTRKPTTLRMSPRRLFLLAFRMLFVLAAVTWATPLVRADVEPVAESEPDTTLLSFEGKQVPGYVQSSENSMLSLSDAHFVDGKQSLKWQWQDGAAWLVIKRPIPVTPGQQRLFGNYADDTFSPWIYLKKPIAGTLRFTFGKQSQAASACGFEFGLSFTGWRTGWVMFGRDMQGKPADDMDYLRIETPKGVTQGTLYLDAVVLAQVVDARHQYPDRQVPFVNARLVKLANDQWLPRPDLLQYAPDNQPSAAMPEVTPAQAAAVDVIESRVDTYSMQGAGQYTAERVDALLKQYQGYEINDGPEGIRGRHINFSKRQDVIYPEHLRKAMQETFIDLGEYQKLMLQLARAYQEPSLDEAQRAAVREAFLFMVRHFLDQGWAEGSSQGTVHHLGYVFREVGPAALLMRDELASEGLLEPFSKAILWYFNTYKVFVPGAIQSDMDYYNTLAFGHLVSILLLPDGPAKVATLQQFSEMFSDILDDQTPGVTNGFKIDGTAFHHNGHYPGYAMGAFSNGSKILFTLSQTPFAITPQAHWHFRNALMTMRLYANPDWAVGMSGRHPMPPNTRSGGILSLKYAFINFVLAGDPDYEAPDNGKAFCNIENNVPQNVDRQVLAAALRMWPELADHPEFAALNVSPEPTPQGYWSLNYAAAGVHRFGNKTVTFKGYNNNVWSSEIYTRDNRFGRYQSHGSIAILNEGGNLTSGYIQAGWDWNRLPGTTGVHLPLEQLASPQRSSLAVTSPNTFAGASHLNHKEGLFAIDLHDDRLPGSKGLVARKSAFSFGPLIVSLGTHISSPNQDYPTQTTLFQAHLKTSDQPFWVNQAEPVTQLPMRSELSSKDASVLVDPYGNGYYLPAGQRVVAQRQHQHSKGDAREEPTEGDFASAWIDHGKSPSDQQYVYAIVLGADIQQMLAFKAQAASTDGRPYEILRQDKKVHAVHHAESGVTGIVVFEPVADLKLQLADSPVRSVSKATLIMIQPQPDGSMEMSICDPSLNLEDGKSSRQTLTVVVQGRWSVVNQPDVTAQPQGSQTLLQVHTQHATPVQLTLKPLPA